VEKPLVRRFKKVAVGGTFDELHKGHIKLLTKAFELGQLVLIGLCTDDFAKKLSKNHKIVHYKERLFELKSFLKKNNFIKRAKIVTLTDPYGPTISDKKIEAIVVSQETEPVARAINMIRRRKGLIPLNIVVISMIPAEDHVSISTTRIKFGEIDREGHLLQK
jgi:pantetheine-phosphate adenylyltransferase